MAFIKDAINVKIFVLVVFVVVAMVSIVVVSYNNIESVNTKYSEKVGELEGTFEELTDVQKSLNRTAEELTIKELREEDLQDRYLTLKDDRDNLFNEKERLLGDIESLNSRIEGYLIQIANKDEEISSLSDEVSHWESEAECLKDRSDADEGSC